MIKLKQYTLRSNGDFAIIEDPTPHKQHPNQQKGLDLYIKVLNIYTGEECFKKMYENKKGLHFKHTGYSPMYLDEFDKTIVYIPYQTYEV